MDLREPGTGLEERTDGSQYGESKPGVAHSVHLTALLLAWPAVRRTLNKRSFPVVKGSRHS